MANPRDPDWQLLKRVGRYLKGAPRAVISHPWQERDQEISTYVDSDWAGDQSTLQSTSGGLCFRGGHVLKSRDSSQRVIALSSGEAELYAQTKGADQTPGMVSMAADFGNNVEGTVYCDSTAAHGIATRTRWGKVRHIRVQYIRLQERMSEGELRVRKIAGGGEPSRPAHKETSSRTVDQTPSSRRHPD